MQVFVVLFQDWDVNEIEGIFWTQEKAEQFRDVYEPVQYRRYLHIEEYEVV